MVKLRSGAAVYFCEGVHHARLQRPGTETPMDPNPSVLRSDGSKSIVVKETQDLKYVP